MTRFDWIYMILLVVCSPCLLVGALVSAKIRAQWVRVFLSLPPALAAAPTKRVWIHAASVGEMNLALQLVKRLAQKQRQLEFVFTTNRETSYELVSKQGYLVYYRPFDFSFSVRILVKRLRPDLLILIETELWPNLIHYCADHMPIFSVNGRISGQHAKTYQRLRYIYGPMVAKLAGVFASDATSARSFEHLGAKLLGCHNLKLGLTPEPPAHLLLQLRELCGVSEKDFVFVAGSLQPEEFKIILDAYTQMKQGRFNVRLIVVPRHPDKQAAFVQIADDLKLSVQLSSKGAWSGSEIYLVDQIGVLCGLYGLAQFVFVGGSFTDRGGQNMIEPVGLGVPTAVGPWTRNFASVVELLSVGGGLAVVNDAKELAHLSQNKDQLARLSSCGLSILTAESDGWDQTIEVLDEAISNLS